MRVQQELDETKIVLVRNIDYPRLTTLLTSVIAQNHRICSPAWREAG